jgi:hypothetical protein
MKGPWVEPGRWREGRPTRCGNGATRSASSSAAAAHDGHPPRRQPHARMRPWRPCGEEDKDDARFHRLPEPSSWGLVDASRALRCEEPGARKWAFGLQSPFTSRRRWVLLNVAEGSRESVAYTTAVASARGSAPPRSDGDRHLLTRPRPGHRSGKSRRIRVGWRPVSLLKPGKKSSSVAASHRPDDFTAHAGIQSRERIARVAAVYVEVVRAGERFLLQAPQNTASNSGGGETSSQ